MLDDITMSWEEIIKEYSAIQKKLEKLAEEIEGQDATSSKVAH